VGEFFSSFDDAWAFFLERDEPLEDFFEALPVKEAYLTTWLALPGERVVREAAAVQNELAALENLRLTPAHFLHVSLGSHEAQLDQARDRLDGFGPLEARYGPVNCFHDAAVLEVASPRFADLVRAFDSERDLTYLLPHLSLGYVDGEPPPEPIRSVLRPLRDREPVTETISEVHLCVVPVARTEILSPWQVAGVVPLD
jgi:hypothetical protein